MISFPLLFMFISLSYASPDHDKDSIFKDIIKSQKFISNIIIISEDQYNIPEGFVYAQIQANKVNPNTIQLLHQGIVQANSKVLYIIDGQLLKPAKVKELVVNIRKFSKHAPIMLFSKLFEYSGSYNLFFIIRNTRHGYDVYEICAYCDGGNDELNKINSWANNAGFKYDLIFPKSFKGKLHGRDFIVTCILSSTIIFKIGKDSKGNQLYSGSEYVILSLTGQMMNFKIKLVYAPKSKFLVTAGMLKSVSSGKADLAAGGIGFGPGRDKFIEYSPTIFAGKYKIVTDKPPKELRFFSFIQPFTWQIWVGLIVPIPIAALILCLVEKFRVPQTLKDERKTYWFWLWEVSKLTLWDTTAITMPSARMICLLGTFMMSIQILIVMYLGELTSFMKSEPYKWDPINTLNQLENSHLKWLTRNGTTIEALLSANPKMAAKKELITTQIPGRTALYKAYLGKMLEEPNTYAIVQVDKVFEAAIALLFADANGNHMFFIGSETVVERQNLFWLQKNAVYNKALIFNILKLQEMGIIQFLSTKHQDEFLKAARKYSRKQNRPLEPVADNVVKLKHMKGSFVALGFSYGFCLLVFAIEFIVFLGKAAVWMKNGRNKIIY